MNISAFPMTWVKQEAPNLNVILEQRGMTLRDYFAAKAMQGCISGTPHSVDIEPTELAKWCYIMADRMLEARG